MQAVNEVKTGIAMTGGLFVWGLSLNDIAAICSIIIAVMVMIEKFPATKHRVTIWVKQLISYIKSKRAKGNE